MPIEIDARIAPLAEKINAVLEYEGNKPEELDWDGAIVAMQELMNLAYIEGQQTLGESWFPAHALTAIHLSYHRDGHNPSGRYYAWGKTREIYNTLNDDLTLKDLLINPMWAAMGWEISINEEIVDYLQKQRDPN